MQCVSRFDCAAMADENFLENPFYIALTKQFADLYAKACARKCIICIPTVSSLRTTSRGRHRTLIPKAELGLHILRPSPLQSLEEGLYDCVQNGYSVKIEGPHNGKKGIIRAYSGFHRDFTAEVLSEEKCYDEKSGGSFTLFVIDHPLGEGMDTSVKTVPILEYTFETLSSASSEIFLRDSIGALESANIIASFKKAIEQIYRTYVLLEGYLDDLADKIRTIVAKSVDEAARAAPAINRRDATAAFEVFGHNILYHIIFTFLFQNEFADREALINNNLRAVKKPITVDGLNIAGATFPVAAATLAKLPAQTSPLQQLVCMAKGIQALQEDLVVFQKEQVRLNRIQSTSVRLSADDTLNLLLFLLASQRVPHLKSSVIYVEKFCWTIPDASLQYALTSFEAAVKYLESAPFNQSRHFETSPINTDSTIDRLDRSPSVDDHFSAESDYKTSPKRLFPGISRPPSSSPTKPGNLSQIDEKLRSLSLFMEESSNLSTPGRSSTDLPPRTRSPLNPTNPPRTASPLDFLSGGLSFGQQK